MRRGSYNFFYEILKDIKNNIDTLIDDLNECINKNHLKIFELPYSVERKNNSLYSVCMFNGEKVYYKSTWKKSKLPDLKKLNIIDYQKGYKNLHVTYLGRQLLDYYNNDNKHEFEKLLKNLIGTYNYKGFRPYAFLVKILNSFFKKNLIDDISFSKLLSLPIDKILVGNKIDKDFLDNVQIIKEATRPKSYIENFLFNSGLAYATDLNSFRLSNSSNQFIEMYFSDEIHNLDELGNLKLVKSGQERKGQKEFRENVLKAYNFKCAITGSELKYNNKYIFEAAHIYPVCAGGSNDITNGIPMLKHLHSLFDRGAFTIIPSEKNKSYKLKISNNLFHKGIFPEKMELLNLPSEKKLFPSNLSLNLHEEYVFNKGVNKYCREINSA